MLSSRYTYRISLAYMPVFALRASPGSLRRFAAGLLACLVSAYWPVFALRASPGSLRRFAAGLPAVAAKRRRLVGGDGLEPPTLSV